MPLSVIPAEAEILRRYIVLHMEPILSNTQGPELDAFRIRPCLCKIKYGELSGYAVFGDAIFYSFLPCWLEAEGSNG